MEIDSPNNFLHAGLIPLVEIKALLKTVQLFRTPIIGSCAPFAICTFRLTVDELAWNVGFPLIKVTVDGTPQVLQYLGASGEVSEPRFPISSSYILRLVRSSDDWKPREVENCTPRPTVGKGAPCCFLLRRVHRDHCCPRGYLRRFSATAALVIALVFGGEVSLRVVAVIFAKNDRYLSVETVG